MKVDEAAAVFAEIEAFIRRFVAFPLPEQATAVVLWAAHTHLFRSEATFPSATPYLAVTAPERRSGKSRLLEVLELVCRRARNMGDTTPATLFRICDQEHPTLLLDEIDVLLGTSRRHTSEKSDELRSMINAGHRPSARVYRTEGRAHNKHVVVSFDVFCPKALAGIGELPETVADRSIPIRLQRRGDEPVDRMRWRKVEPVGRRLGERLAQAMWVVAPLLADEPALPSELHDRAQDGWEPLMAIADVVGGPWPRRARVAAVVLHSEDSERESLGVRLLQDLAGVWRAGESAVSTATLVRWLIDLDEAPWSDLDGRVLSATKLARMLRPYGPRSQSVTVGAVRMRGYQRADLEEVWRRYLPTWPGDVWDDPQRVLPDNII